MSERRSLGKNRRRRERRKAKPGSTTRHEDKTKVPGGMDYVPKRIRWADKIAEEDQ